MKVVQKTGLHDNKLCWLQLFHLSENKMTPLHNLQFSRKYLYTTCIMLCVTIR